MTIHIQAKKHLQQLQFALQTLDLWQVTPPDEKAFMSTQPFAIDTMTANEWLQWIFIPRMYALIENQTELPSQISISPYVEEALKETENLSLLLSPLIEMEQLLQNQ